MNRLLQRFVGDAQTQRPTGEADWSMMTQQPANASYHHQQQQLSAQQQHQYAATNNHGLEEIPLSSPVSASTGAFFDSQTHFGRPPPQQQPQQIRLKQRQEAAADAFFQSEGVSPPSRPGSADVFAQPPRSGASSHSSALGGFFESPAAAADPFASAPTSSRSAFDAPQQQPALSTSGSVSDLFASPPRSTTPSFDGFEQQHLSHQQHGNASLSASSSSGDLFAQPPQAQPVASFYDGFAHPQQSDNGWATADELFASAGPSATTLSTSFHSSGEQQSPFASAPGSFHGSNGAEQQAREAAATPPAPPAAGASIEDSNSASDPFANPPRSTTSAFSTSGFDQQHFHGEVASANGHQADVHADPFSQHARSSSGNGHSHSDHIDTAADAGAVANGVCSTPSPTQVTDFFSEAPPTPSASSLFDSQPSERSFDGASKPPTPLQQPSPAKATQTSSFVGFSSAEAHREPFSEPQTTTSTASRNDNQMSIKELSPVADDDGVEAVVQSLKKTTLDDSVKLVEMYKQMAERLEGEKNELLKVLADQADQFYQMQEYIASLEQELAALRSQRK